MQQAFDHAVGQLGLSPGVSWSGNRHRLPLSSHSRSQLEQQNVFHLDEVEISWVVSIPAIGGLIGGPLGGYFLDRIGRKMTLVVTCVPFVFGWTCIAASPNFYCMLFGRLLTGYAAGVMDVAVPVYISEISASSIRGFMGSCHELSTNFGILFVFTLGIFLSWNWLAIACSGVPVLLMVLMMAMPESPRWLLMKDRKLECVDALKWLRGHEDTSLELTDMEDNVKRQDSRNFQWKEFLEARLYKPLIIVVGLMFFQQSSGYVAISQYMVSILSSTRSTWDPNVQTAIVGAVGFGSILLSAMLVDRFGRRAMLSASSIIMIFSLVGLASFFTVKYHVSSFNYTSISVISWLPATCLMTFSLGAALGYGPVPFHMAGELFPLKARGLGSGIAMASLCFFSFLTSFAFPHLLTLLHVGGPFWILAGFAAMGLVFVLTIVPETKGMSLEEIEAGFRNK